MHVRVCMCVCVCMQLATCIICGLPAGDTRIARPASGPTLDSPPQQQLQQHQQQDGSETERRELEQQWLHTASSLAPLLGRLMGLASPGLSAQVEPEERDDEVESALPCLWPSTLRKPTHSKARSHTGDFFAGVSFTAEPYMYPNMSPEAPRPLAPMPLPPPPPPPPPPRS